MVTGKYLYKDDIAQYPYKHQHLAKNTTLYTVVNLDILLKFYLPKNLHYLQLLFTKSLKSTLKDKTKNIKHKLTKMPVVTHSGKTPLG